MLNDSYFILFANCIPVKGFKRSIICDLLRNKYVFAPNELYKILTEYKKLSINEIKAKYNHRHDSVIDEYFQFLIENEFIFLCNKEDLEKFPELNLSYEDSCLISNAILEIDKKIGVDIKNIILQLNELSCKNLQIKFVSEYNLNYMGSILGELENTGILFVEFIFPHGNSINMNDLVGLFKKYPRLYNCYIYSSNIFKIIPQNDLGNIILIKDDLSIQGACGLIHPNNFTVNIEFFTEAFNHNSCLNRKIAIDEKGNIKNCLLMDKVYGNIKNDCLTDIVNNKEFRGLWDITKDSVAVCKDCEFRYICLDCRANLQDENDTLSKPKHCSYNPYTAKGF